MKGRKPDLNNVAQHPAAANAERATAQQRADADGRARDLRPHGLGKAVIKVWDRLAPELILLGRLKAHHVDAFEEYCRIMVRLREARDYLDDNEWTYVTTGRHGSQHKSRPEVAQLNDDWRKWRSLTASFGLTPSDERGLNAAQGELFDDFDGF